MTKKEKIRKIVKGLSSPNETVLKNLSAIDEEVANFTAKLKAGITAQTVQEISDEFKKIERRIKPLGVAVQQLGQELANREGNLKEQLMEAVGILRSDLRTSRGSVSQEIREATQKAINKLMEEVVGLDVANENMGEEMRLHRGHMRDELSKIETKLADNLLKLRQEVNGIYIPDEKKWEKKLDELQKRIEKLRADMLSWSSRGGGGGNANRNILVGNNPSTLGRYTDLNLKAGTNITLSYTNNDNLKTTDLTITSSGGAGTNRNISTVSVSSVVAAVASTDYVIIAGDGIKLTLPTAVSNTNGYTFKNKAASSVLVVADGAETIDGSASILMPTQYTAVDLISDNANWHVT